MHRIKLPLFITPFALLSAICVSIWLADYAPWLTLNILGTFTSRVIEGPFISGVIGPGLLFAIGITWYLSKFTNLAFKKISFIVSTTLSYIIGYSLGYIMIVLFLLAGNFIATFFSTIGAILGTILFIKSMELVKKINERESIFLILFSAILFFPNLNLMTAVGDGIFVGDTFDYFLHIFPFLESINESMVFGGATINSGMLIIIWQIVTSFVIGRSIDQDIKTRSTH